MFRLSPTEEMDLVFEGRTITEGRSQLFHHIKLTVTFEVSLSHDSLGDELTTVWGSSKCTPVDWYPAYRLCPDVADEYPPVYVLS